VVGQKEMREQNEPKMRAKVKERERRKGEKEENK
jgi:hypothetical protein